MATITSLLATIPQEIIYAHIVPYYSRTWLYVSKRCHKIAFKYLLQDPRVDELITKVSWGLLHKAIIHNSVSGVRLLLQDPRVDVNWFAINQLALKRGNYQILKMLANCPRLLDHIFMKVIWWAAEHHHFKLVVDLLQDPRADPTSGVLSETVLTAIRVHNFSIVYYIVTKFGYNDALSEIADQALLLAVENDDYSIVKLLVEHGCDPSGINNEILRKAVQKKNYEIVEYLLQFPDVDPMDDRPFYINNPDIEDPMGSAIEEAINSRDIILIEMLVQHPEVQLTDEMRRQLEHLV